MRRQMQKEPGAMVLFVQLIVKVDGFPLASGRSRSS